MKKILKNLISRISPKEELLDPNATAGSTTENASYGRIQKHTEELFRSQIKLVLEPTLSYLPLNVSKEIRDWTATAVLTTVLRDWRENGNLEPLSHQDVSDLGSFVELAVHLACVDMPESASQDANIGSIGISSVPNIASKPAVDTGDSVPNIASKPAANTGDSVPKLEGERAAVYKTVLQSLLSDWLHNWNADGTSGPPK